MITSSYRPIQRLSIAEIRRLYEIFAAYYDHAPLETFLSDLSKKTGVFLLQRKRDGLIVGFSTYAVLHMNVGRRRVRGVFSGDTVIEREYWGSRALQSAFIRRLLIEIAKNPFIPQYWLLISKGYKTYLLLANNFPEYYPRIDREDPQLCAVVLAYCERMFPGKLNLETMLLDFGPNANCLKDGVAGVTPELRRDVPKIAFFELCNPTWQQGTELPCAGRADLKAFFQTMWPQFQKKFFRPSAETGEALAGRALSLPAGMVQRVRGWFSGD